MPNVTYPFAGQMENPGPDQAGVVHAGMRLLMERDNAHQFHALKANLEEALREVQAGEFGVFDPQAYEPDAETGPS